MQPMSHKFNSNVKKALADEKLQKALFSAKSGLVKNRLKAVSVISEFEQYREQAKQIKNHTLSKLDYYLEQFEENFTAQGGKVHWARDAKHAQEIIISICQDHDAKAVVKSKSMGGEEIDINTALEKAGIDPVETDLGEYIVQLAGEPPSHIIVPAVHKTRDQIGELFFNNHEQYGCTERLHEAADMVTEARKIMRAKFLAADVGITGANFLVAETGSSVIVTNEGNGDLSCTLPKVHIVTAGLEKVVPDLESVSLLMKLLPRSAIGQEITAYTTVTTGPKRAEDRDGPEEMHVVLIDNGRTEILGSEIRDILRCIRCGACLNHCPVYGNIGGHAYGWVYPGPMGAVLTTAILGLEEAGNLPNACTMNGRCASVCPVKIPLPDLLRSLRNRQFDKKSGSLLSRFALSAWAQLVSRPALYHFANSNMVRLLRLLGGKKGSFSYLPFVSGWLMSRDLPVPQAESFHTQWHNRKAKGDSNEQG